MGWEALIAAKACNLSIRLLRLNATPSAYYAPMPKRPPSPSPSPLWLTLRTDLAVIVHLERSRQGLLLQKHGTLFSIPSLTLPDTDIASPFATAQAVGECVKLRGFCRVVPADVARCEEHFSSGATTGCCIAFVFVALEPVPVGIFFEETGCVYLGAFRRKGEDLAWPCVAVLGCECVGLMCWFGGIVAVEELVVVFVLPPSLTSGFEMWHYGCSGLLRAA